MTSRNNRALVAKLAALTLAMFAFGFALVPLYDVFCELTGFRGETVASVTTDTAIDGARKVRIELLGSVADAAPWEFAPIASHLDVHPGGLYETHFEARNLTDQPLAAQAVPSVAPAKVARYLQKLECFCFETQAFAPHEARMLKVVFSVDPALPPAIDTLSLAYTLFAAANPPAAER
jgi:cytochrome c oxidase assembly protein subunit 11